MVYCHQIYGLIQDFIVENGYDPVYGARPLKRFIQKHVETLIARRMISDDLMPNTVLVVDSDADSLVVTKKA